jgi:outer membrane murein-binding lipoprotein Lpp
MKQLLIVAAVASLVLVAGCNKEDILNSPEYAEAKNTYGCAALVVLMNRLDNYIETTSSDFTAFAIASRTLAQRRFDRRCIPGDA